MDAGPSSDFDYLPKPTTDMAQLEHDFVRWGYCIVADAMTPAQYGAVVDRLTDQAAAERAAGVAHVSHKGSSQHVFNCLPKGQVFRDVIEFAPDACTGGPVVEELLDKMLGRGWYGGTFHGSLVHQGGGDQGMHQVSLSTLRSASIKQRPICHSVQDQGEIPIDLQPNAPMKCLIIWTCSEFSQANGGTYM
eukprot:COSAG04_NODE_4935_length_1818_cov_2.121582_3_plen_190_part_01